jgi:hypothetical protein
MLTPESGNYCPEGSHLISRLVRSQALRKGSDCSYPTESLIVFGHCSVAQSDLASRDDKHRGLDCDSPNVRWAILPQ